jgi:hypothetical protein
MQSSSVLDTRSVEEEHEAMLKLLEAEIAELEIAEERLRSMKREIASNIQVAC